MTPVPYRSVYEYRVVEDALKGGVGFSVTLEDKGDKWLDRVCRRITRVMEWITEYKSPEY